MLEEIICKEGSDEEANLEKEIEELIAENFELVKKAEKFNEVTELSFWQRLKFLLFGRRYLDKTLVDEETGPSPESPKDWGVFKGKLGVEVWADERTEELRNRMDSNRVLRLTMDDIAEYEVDLSGKTKKITFEDASVRHIKGTLFAGFEAMKIILIHEGRTRVLKDKTRKTPETNLMKN